jgi:CRISPR/Cas system-associated protein Csm6
MDGKVEGLLTVNVVLNAVTRFFEIMKPALGTLLIMVNILVGAATVYYLWRKARAVQIPNAKPKRKK